MNCRIVALAGVIVVAPLASGCGAITSAHSTTTSVPSIGKRPSGPVQTSLSVAISLSANQGRAGQSIPGTASITNSSGRSIQVTACSRSDLILVGLANERVHFEPIIPAIACTRKIPLAPGVTSVPITILTSYMSCAQVPAGVTKDNPPCAPTGMPPLPPGRYTTKVYLWGLPSGTALPTPTTVILR